MLPESTLALSARSLTSSLGADSGDTPLLDGVSLTVGAGEIVDITGPSGSGKTTFLRALARLLPDAEGDLVLKGTPAREMAPEHWRRRVALLPQKPAIVDGTVRDNLLLPWKLKTRHGEQQPTDAELESALSRVALDGIGVDRDSAKLSVGQQARVVLLRVLLTKPDVLLLDEPDAALDDVSADAVRTVIAGFAEKGGAVVRVRHRGNDALADKRLRLAGGSLTEVSE